MEEAHSPAKECDQAQGGQNELYNGKTIKRGLVELHGHVNVSKQINS